MLTIGYILATEGKPAMDYSWALLVVCLAAAAKFIGDAVLTLIKSRDAAKNKAESTVSQSEREIDSLRNEVAKSRHDALVTLIKGVDEKLGATNQRIDALERRLQELGEEHHRLSVEFEKHRVLHAEVKA